MPAGSGRGSSRGLAARLRQAVRAAGGNQTVADRSGVPLATVNNYVRGRHGMKIEPLSALATACGVSLQWLVFGEAVVASPGFAPVEDAAATALSEIQASISPAAAITGIDVPVLAKAIEVVQAITGTSVLRDDATGLARRIASAYAVLIQPPGPRG